MEPQTITIDAQVIIYGLSALLLFIFQFVLGWFAKTLHQRIGALESKDEKLSEVITELSLKLPSNYVTKPEHEKALDNIFGALRRIEDKLDTKVDKP